jgi:hypothetical protein
MANAAPVDLAEIVTSIVSPFGLIGILVAAALILSGVAGRVVLWLEVLPVHMASRRQPISPTAGYGHLVEQGRSKR